MAVIPDKIAAGIVSLAAVIPSLFTNDLTTPYLGVGVSTIGHVGVHEDDLRDFAKWGMTTRGAAERLRIKRDSLVTRLSRIGDPDLTAAFERNDIEAEVAA